MNKTRLEAFSDGVLAIIITIMVLELKVPDGTSWEAIKPVLPIFISYILSFINIGIYWGNHHHLLHTVKRINSRIMWANLNLLFWLSLVPFGTAWMGENSFDAISVAGYGFLLMCCGGSYYILQKTIMSDYKESSPLIEALKKSEIKGIISSVSYLLSIPLSFVHPLIGGALFVFVAVLWLVPDKGIERALRE